MRFFDRPFVVPALVLGVTLFAGLAVVGWGIAARGQGNAISVTGSAAADATADEATWSIQLSRTAYEGGVPSGTAQLTRDANAVASYFTQQKLASSSVTVAAITAYQDYSSDKNVPSTYSLTVSVTVSTSDVQAIDRLSHDIAALNALVPASTLVSPQQPQYYLSTLPALRVSLLGDAIKDAKARAMQIAQSGGSKVGALQLASSGVVQVLAPNSTDVEGYGQYDTSTIQKQVMVTVHASFYVR